MVLFERVSPVSGRRVAVLRYAAGRDSGILDVRPMYSGPVVERYAAGSESRLGPADIAAIVEALECLPWVRFCKSLMEGGRDFAPAPSAPAPETELGEPDELGPEPPPRQGYNPSSPSAYSTGLPEPVPVRGHRAKMSREQSQAVVKYCRNRPGVSWEQGVAAVFPRPKNQRFTCTEEACQEVKAYCLVHGCDWEAGKLALGVL